eukprot:6535923-Ditylum_brightwellii.AAC.2
MWCGRRNCSSQEEYQKEKEGCKGKKKEKKEATKSEDFKVALSALLSDEDIKSIKEQFLKTEQQGRREQLNVL